jgi:hypothetical protein
MIKIASVAAIGPRQGSFHLAIGKEDGIDVFFSAGGIDIELGRQRQAELTKIYHCDFVQGQINERCVGHATGVNELQVGNADKRSGRGR